MRYYFEYNPITKKYDVYMRTRSGQITYDCSFNIREKAEQYCRNMSEY